MALFSKGPCVLGIEVFKEMFKTKTGIVPLPRRNETSLGGHAINACGYDDEKKMVKFKNSWSRKWGQQGFGYLPYAYIERYMMDAWSSVDIEDSSPLTLASVSILSEVEGLNYNKKALV